MSSFDITAESLAASGFRLLYAGDDYSYVFTLKQGGVALDLTGGSAWFTIKEREVDSDANALLQLSVGAGITLTTPLSGIITVAFAAADTATLRGKWVYDLQVKVITPTTRVITMATGHIEFLDNITVTT